jgi:hypothetical protein
MPVKNIRRIAARLLDLAVFFSITSHIAGGWRDHAFVATFALISIVGEIGLVSGFGATIGKLLLGLRIRAIDGSKVGVLLATHRTFAVWVAVLWAFFASLGPWSRSEPRWPRGSEEATWDELLGTRVFEAQLRVHRPILSRTGNLPTTVIPA